jgi:4-amino-4-deoxy-L-arabinose transferase-like glycosyltransferase
VSEPRLSSTLYGVVTKVADRMHLSQCDHIRRADERRPPAGSGALTISHQLIILVSLLSILEGALAVWGLHRPAWGDEAHFADTIRFFGNGVTLQSLTHYQEMSAPLPFIIYSFWGRLFGFALLNLRLLSLLIAFCTFLASFRLFALVLDGNLALYAAIFLALNPYVAGSAIFVFTDMLALLCLVMACTAVLKRSPAMLFVSLSSGLLSRQYLAFFWVAVAVFLLVRLGQQTRDKQDSWMLMACAGSALPLAALMVLWRGLSPDSSVRSVYLNEPLAFHSTAATLYVILLLVYLLPIIAVRWRQFYRDRRVLGASFLLSWLYWLAPVTASLPRGGLQIDTVGYFHRFLRLVCLRTSNQIVFYLLFLAALPVLLSIVTGCYTRLSRHDTSVPLLWGFSVVSFLLVMPMSYLTWEKYFILVLPPALMLLLNTQSGAEQTGF